MRRAACSHGRAALSSFRNRNQRARAAQLVPTDEMAADLGKLRFERLHVVGRGVNPQVFTPSRRRAELRESWGAGPDTMVAMCVSRFAPEKNFPLHIEAFEHMRKARPDMMGVFRHRRHRPWAPRHRRA